MEKSDRPSSGAGGRYSPATPTPGADLIRAEIGKPRGEALAGDLIASLDGIRWTVRHSRRALADRSIGPGPQQFLQISKARVSYRPLGVVGVIGTWNYPLF